MMITPFYSDENKPNGDNLESCNQATSEYGDKSREVSQAKQYPPAGSGKTGLSDIVSWLMFDDAPAIKDSKGARKHTRRMKAKRKKKNKKMNRKHFPSRPSFILVL